MNPESEKSPPAPLPNKALTITANRLVGSDACMNCGTELKGPFCYYCGQPDKNFMRFFPVLLREMLEDFMDFDSRFMRTVKPLLFKPGKLTRDYLDGKRFRYVPPLRLYIFSSIAFFFIAAILASDGIQISSEADSDTETGIQIDDEEQQKLTETLKNLDPELAEEVNQVIEEAQSEKIERGLTIDDDEINLNGEPWDRETNPFIIPLAPDWINDWVNNEIGESPEKGRQIEQNPDLIKDKVFDVLPVTMFVLLPIVALLFKFWYLFAKRYYIEHLVFALHNHAFLFVTLLIIILGSTFAGWQEPSEEGPVSTAVRGLNIVLGIWIPVYLLVSLKRVYQQGWGLTILKYSCIGICYAILLSLVTAFVALLSFVLL